MLFRNNANLTPVDLEALRRAKQLLEQPSLAVQLSDMIGRPVERTFALLPPNVHNIIQSATQIALRRSLDIAVRTLDRPHSQEEQGVQSKARDRLHLALTAGAGGASGLFGFTALSLELPISTALILRSIADIAASEGHDLTQLETRLACLEVFAFGSASESDDAADTGYWIVRASLNKTLSDAAAFLTRNGLVRRGAPPLVNLLSRIASRYSINVSAQVAAKAIPVISAISGAGINAVFMRHYQNVAHGHFIVKRLEARYGAELVEAAYQTLTTE